MYHQVDKLDKVQEYCFGGCGPAVKTDQGDYLVACAAAILGHLFWGLEQDAMNNRVTTTAGMFTKETALKSQKALGLARVQKECDRQTDGSSGCRWAHRAWTHRT
jgi:hypothetical protein